MNTQPRTIASIVGLAGSGTVLIAAERTARKARTLEIDPHYVDVAVRRWEIYTGKVAVLAATGRTFDEATEERASESLPPLLPASGRAAATHQAQHDHEGANARTRKITPRLPSERLGQRASTMSATATRTPQIKF